MLDGKITPGPLKQQICTSNRAVLQNDLQISREIETFVVYPSSLFWKHHAGSVRSTIAVPGVLRACRRISTYLRKVHPGIGIPYSGHINLSRRVVIKS